MSVYGRGVEEGACEVEDVVFVLVDEVVVVVTGFEVDVEVLEVEAGATDTLLLAECTTTIVAAIHGFVGSKAMQNEISK